MKTQLQRIGVRVSGHVPRRLRNAESRPLTEKPGPSAAAVGATRGVGVMLIARELIILAVLELPQRFKQLGDLHRAGQVGWLLQYQQQPRPTRQVSLGMVPQSAVADLVKTTRQDVL